jgi:nitrate reductase gamma subunit
MLLVLTLSIAAAIFLAGNLVRLIRTLRAPRPLRWELYPIPKGPRERQRYGGSYFEEADWWSKPTESGHAGEIVFIAQEVLLLQSVRKNFPDLWLWSWLLHWGLYLYILAALSALSGSTLGVETLIRCAGYVGGVACIFGCLGSLGLLALRSELLRLRPYTTRLAKFNLLFFAAFFLTGGLVLSGAAVQPTRGLTLTALMSGHSIARLHLILLAFFLAYFPFTHMAHAYMKFFSWHGMRWDDLPARHVSSASAALADNVRRNVTWAAPHVGGGVGTTWAETVADKDGRGASSGA